MLNEIRQLNTSIYCDLLLYEAAELDIVTRSNYKFNAGYDYIKEICKLWCHSTYRYPYELYVEYKQHNLFQLLV